MKNATYKHEEEEPSQPSQGHMMSGWGCEDMKGQADPIAYGQAGESGCKSDSKKMHAQFKDYHWS